MSLLSDELAKSMVCADLDCLDEPDILGQVDTWWQLYSDRSQELRIAYCKRRACQMLLAKLRRKISVTVGKSQLQVRDRMQTVNELYKMIMDEINFLDPSSGLTGSITPVSTLPDSYQDNLDSLNTDF